MAAMATSTSPDPVTAAMGARASLDGMGVRATNPVSRSVPPTMAMAMATAMGPDEGTPCHARCHLQRKRTARFPRCLGTAGLYQTCIIQVRPTLMRSIPSLLHCSTADCR